MTTVLPACYAYGQAFGGKHALDQRTGEAIFHHSPLLSLLATIRSGRGTLPLIMPVIRYSGSMNL